MAHVNFYDVLLEPLSKHIIFVYDFVLTENEIELLQYEFKFLFSFYMLCFCVKNITFEYETKRCFM